jgi:hypothetical protein
MWEATLLLCRGCRCKHAAGPKLRGQGQAWHCRGAASPLWPAIEQERRWSGAQPPVGAAAGPKLRKWYGEGERGAAVAQPRGPGGAPRGEPDAPARTAVLVTDADSPTGEQIVLQLILARWRPPPRPLALCRHGWRCSGFIPPFRVLVSRWSGGPARRCGLVLEQGRGRIRFGPACIRRRVQWASGLYK